MSRLGYFCLSLLALLIAVPLPRALATGAASAPTDAYAVMHLHYQAIGGLERLQATRGSFSEGTIRHDGLRGEFRRWELRPLSYRLEEDYGLISQIQGDSGKEAWLMDTNGHVQFFRDEETITRREISRRLDDYEHLDRDSRVLSLAYAGTVTVDDRLCHEVILTNSLNDDVAKFYFDTDTYLLIRSIIIQPDVEIHTEYGDYRDVDGILVSFYQKSRYLPWEKVEETWTQHYRIDPMVAQDYFAAPSSQRDFRFLSDDVSAEVPFLFADNLLHLPVSIGSSTGYWVLDSGASMSVIDGEYAEELGLRQEGSIRGFGFGDLFELGFAEIPEYRVGRLHFDPQKVYVMDGLRSRSYEPVINGILGYDFLSRFTVEIDYHNRKVRFHDPDIFAYVGDGQVVSAPLKYRTFTVPVTVDNRFSSRWTIDLGAYRSSIHYPFAEEHGLLGLPGVPTVSQGMATTTREKTVNIGCLSIAGFSLSEQLVTIPLERGKGASALGEVGGNLGNSTLRHFHLFLDYRNQRVIFEPGPDFHAAFPKDHSGLLIGRDENDLPMASFVAADSPADEAGIIAGDRIISIAGEKLAKAQPVLPLREVLSGPPGTVVTIELLRDGEPLRTAIILENLHLPFGPRCQVKPAQTP